MVLTILYSQTWASPTIYTATYALPARTAATQNEASERVKLHHELK